LNDTVTRKLEITGFQTIPERGASLREGFDEECSSEPPLNFNRGRNNSVGDPTLMSRCTSLRACGAGVGAA
jgi:hypothetical protein